MKTLIALVLGLAVAGGAAAQSASFPPPGAQPNPYQAYPQPGYGGGFGSMYGGAPEPERPTPRGLFALTLAGLVAQGVGTSLAQGVGGSILKWFSSERSTDDKTATSNNAAAPHAGLAYEVHSLGANGASVVVDAAQHEFRTGDRFVVHFRPTLPGRIAVFNTNAAGVTTQIDHASVAAGALNTLGPYEFVGAPGNEMLRIMLEPCATQVLMTASRSIVRVSAAASASGEMPLADCGAPRPRGLRTRSIAKVASDGGTAFALDPLSERERASGELAPRAVEIRLIHR